MLMNENPSLEWNYTLQLLENLRFRDMVVILGL